MKVADLKRILDACDDEALVTLHLGPTLWTGTDVLKFDTLNTGRVFTIWVKSVSGVVR